MGLLDDAIREHLELKRRHGASEEEISQKEAEALGPARRDFPVQPAPEDAGPAEPVAEQAPPDASAVTDDVLPPEPEPASPEAVAEPAPPPEPAPPEPELASPELEPASPEPEPELPEPEPDPAPFEDAPAAEEEEEPSSERDDVLEETPEFLQDAPEHDRLWFEQKPPRDFDFE